MGEIRGLNFDNIIDEQDFDLFASNEEDNTPQDNEENEENKTAEVDPNELFDGEPESVGSEETDEEKEDTTPANGQGTSPNFYSSIAEAFATDGIFPDLDEDSIKNVKNAEDFRKVVDDYLNNSLEDWQRRIKEAIELDADTAAIRQFEGSINFLNNITDDVIRAENEQGENLRKNLIYQDYINRGFSKARAEKEVNRTIESGNDIDDAIEALDSLKNFYAASYDKYMQELRDRDAEEKENLKKREKKIRDAIFDTKAKVFGDIELDKSTRQRMYESVTKPIYRDKETGETYTEVQKYAQDNPEDFWVKMSFFYTMTDGFKSLDKLVGSKVKKGIKRGLRDLEGKINSTSRTSAGDISFISGVTDNESYLGRPGVKLDF